MPCRVTDEEVRAMEQGENSRRYGIASTDADIAVTVACQAMRFIEAHCSEVKLKPPKLAQLWWEEHKRRDAERQADENAANKQKEADERATLKRLQKKYPR